MEEKHMFYFTEKLEELKQFYIASRRTESDIRNFLKQIDQFQADKWKLLKQHIKFGGSDISTGSLQFAVRTRNAKLLEQLLESVRNINMFLDLSVLDPIRSFSQEVNLCAYCCYYNSPECLKLVLSKDPSLENIRSRAISDYAMRSGNPLILDMLKEKGAVKQDSLITALKFTSVSSFNWLFDNSFIPRRLNQTDLAKLSIAHGNLFHFRAFAQNMDKKVNFNPEFLQAVKEGHISSCRILLTDYNVNPNYVGEDSVLPFQISIDNGDVGMASLLLSYPEVLTSSLGQDNSIPILTAVKYNNIDLVQRISNSPSFDPNFNSGHGKTPLIIATQLGFSEVVECLLKCRIIQTNPSVYVDFINEEGETALFIACREGFSEIVQLLLKAGASTNIKNKEGKTAKDVATTQTIQHLFDNEEEDDEI